MDLTSFVARRWWLLPLLAVVVAGTVATNLGRAPQIVLGIGAGLVLLAVDWWLAAALVNGLLVGIYFATGGENGPVFFTIIAAAYLAASSTRVRSWLPVVIAGGVLVWAGLLVRGIRQDDLTVNGWQSLGVGALVAAAAAIATARRSRADAQAARVERTATAERLRMAQELHDGVGHGLSVIAMQAGVALHVLDQDPAQAKASLEAIRATAKESLTALRAELAAMSGESAPRRPAPGVNELPALVERVRGAGIQVDLAGRTDDLSPAIGEAVYAVVQESLTNVLRHADAARARIRIERDEQGGLMVSVTDDGSRATADAGSGDRIGDGIGIRGMRRRVERLGGTLDAGPGVAGFAVRAQLPPSGEELR